MNHPNMQAGQIPIPIQQPLHVIHFNVPVSHLSIQQLQDRILCALERGADRIQLRISSVGGSLDAGFAAFGLLTSLPIPLHTHNSSNVESIAVLMYLAGQARTAAPHSRFLLHPLHWTTNGTIDHARMAEWTTSLDFDRERYTTIFSEATQGAQVPLDIEECLRDRAKVIGPTAAASHGITTTSTGTDGAETNGAVVDASASREVHVLPLENVVHWWVNGF